jgi:hypothetical protein
MTDQKSQTGPAPSSGTSIRSWTISRRAASHRNSEAKLAKRSRTRLCGASRGASHLLDPANEFRAMALTGSTERSTACDKPA